MRLRRSLSTSSSGSNGSGTSSATSATSVSSPSNDDRYVKPLSGSQGRSSTTSETQRRCSTSVQLDARSSARVMRPSYTGVLHPEEVADLQSSELRLKVKLQQLHSTPAVKHDIDEYVNLRQMLAEARKSSGIRRASVTGLTQTAGINKRSHEKARRNAAVATLKEHTRRRNRIEELAKLSHQNPRAIDQRRE